MVRESERRRIGDENRRSGGFAWRPYILPPLGTALSGFGPRPRRPPSSLFLHHGRPVAPLNSLITLHLLFPDLGVLWTLVCSGRRVRQPRSTEAWLFWLRFLVADGSFGDLLFSLES
ncbi:hypothetical protein BRADI_1g44405v3 [Brachypodium distachyon]|uniref:Uncharacterized protein n=1 Tax=Brachypodium distachyon TaxID=15368 RepID=A0A0Q3K336_BRADI|nr:hypothetical protein BRADI_1g44405v3 [Brachypodium distachyon]